MKINSKDFLVRSEEKVKLKKWPTNVKPVYKSKEQYHQILAEHIKEMSSLQSLLYASNRYSLLLIFQGMDTAGKDGVIKHVKCLVSIHKDAECLVSNILVPRNLNMIFYGAQLVACQNADELVSLIAPIMRKY